MKIDFLDHPDTAQEVRIEILPLIDVIFCILTFFILAAVGLTRQQAIDLDLPRASTGAPLPGQGLGAEGQLQERLYVSVDAVGQVYVDQQPVGLDWLRDVLQQHQQTYPDGLVVVFAARDARYEEVVAVLDLVRSVEGSRVALATLPEAPATELPFPEEGTDLLQPGEDGLLLPEPNPGSGEFDPLAPENFPPGEDPLIPPDNGTP